MSGATGGASERPAVSVTFDNLGEAAQLELGMWPPEVPQGQHFTVLEVLPRLLELLGARNLRATFFVEGLNAELYPDALRAIARAGHEVAVHAWRHEEWGALDAAAEAELLERATRALRTIDLEPRGFRPPGGGLTRCTLPLLAEHGYRYVSPAGEREGVLEGLAVLPFRWRLVDAYAFLPQFADLRERGGESAEPPGTEWMRTEMIAALRAHAAPRAEKPLRAGESARAGAGTKSERGGEHLVLLFHPFATAFTGDAGWAALADVLEEVARLEAAGAVAALRMDEAAAALLARSASVSAAPQLDETTWTTSAD
jgi:peptidoglycan/xylan/chitin deacetylase (PgdA/CDA1 family)